MKMKHLTLAVVRSQKQQLLDELVRHGCVEVDELSESLAEEYGSVLKGESSNLMQYRADQQSLAHAVELLNKYAPEKKPLLSAKPEADCEDFLSDSGLQGSIDFARTIEAKDEEVRRISAEESRLRSVSESLKPWLDFGMNLSCTGTEYASVIMGSIPAKIDLASVEAALAETGEETELFRINEDKAAHYVAIICSRDLLQSVQEVLRQFNFTATAFGGMDGTARECLSATENQLSSLAAEKQQTADAIAAESVRRNDLKFAADRMTVKVAKAEAEEKLEGTESTVVLTGWILAEKEEEMASVFEKYDCAWETSEPVEEEYPEVPVKLKNNKITNGLNMVTNMYSLPQYGTVDPNPLMAPFFILFYGLMMADMGYGLIMIIAALVAMKKIKPRKGSLSFCQLLLWGGISTFVMGILTGGFFGDAPEQVAKLINPNTTFTGLPALFSPLNDSMMVLIGAMILGVIHLNTGMVINAVQKCKHGDVLGMVFYEGALWVILIGAALMYFKIGTIGGIPIVLVIGLVMLFYGGTRDKKGFGKVTSIFGTLYNEATGWFGDILSYARIMALMLAGSVVATVFNTIGAITGNLFTFALVFIIGHALNFGLNLLGCYVHDLRLQCLEYFGKFYQDGGRAFAPLEINTKFYNVKE